jgi:phosphatidylserine decarboxylase
VAGWGVGNITLPRLPRFKPRSRRLVRIPVAPPLPVERGDWIATFELGSTAVLITEPAAHQTPCVQRDERIRYGQPLFSFRPAVVPASPVRARGGSARIQTPETGTDG